MVRFYFRFVGMFVDCCLWIVTCAKWSALSLPRKWQKSFGFLRKLSTWCRWCVNEDGFCYELDYLIFVALWNYCLILLLASVSSMENVSQWVWTAILYALFVVRIEQHQLVKVIWMVSCWSLIWVSLFSVSKFHHPFLRKILQE